MAGLGTVNENNGLYLSVAGGFIWNRKADQSDPNYATQTYQRADKTEGVRAGARYADLTGKVIAVQFRTHEEYGESINVTVAAGEDTFILSISTNNRYSQDLMKALLKMDLEKEIFIKPYDFIGTDKKRAMGITFKQNGTKLDLKIAESPSKEGDWFKTASKKEIKRFFEDLNDWFVAEVEAKVIPALPEIKKDDSSDNSSEDTRDDSEDQAETPKAEVKKEAPKAEVKKETPKEEVSLTPLKMKAALKSYIEENYPGKELPKLDKDGVVTWYNLSQAMEELPFEDLAEVSQDDIDSQLDALAVK